MNEDSRQSPVVSNALGLGAATLAGGLGLAAAVGSVGWGAGKIGKKFGEGAEFIKGQNLKRKAAKAAKNADGGTAESVAKETVLNNKPPVATGTSVNSGGSNKPPSPQSTVLNNKPPVATGTSVNSGGSNKSPSPQSTILNNKPPVATGGGSYDDIFGF